jgi:hypothetical protein
LLAGVLLGATAARAAAEAIPWDQQKVIRLTRDLTLQASKVKDGIRSEYDIADKESARYFVLHDVMDIHHRSIALLGLLRAGKGREESEPLFRRIQSLVEHAQRDMQRFPEIEKQRKHIDAADAKLAELAAYYSGG